jgi:hypothetical protein
LRDIKCQIDYIQYEKRSFDLIVEGDAAQIQFVFVQLRVWKIVLFPPFKDQYFSLLNRAAANSSSGIRRANP